MSERPKIQATYLFLLIILGIFFWGEMVFLDKIPFYRDTLLQFYPWQSFADSSISSGIIPLWNNYSGCGTPFIGNLQSSVFYPLKVFFLCLPFTLAIKLFIIANFIVAAFGMFFLVKDFKVSSRSAFFAALIFCFNGYLVSRVEFWSVFAASVWLPLIMLFIKKFTDSGKIKYFSLSVFSLAMPLLAGSAQIYFYNLLILTAFALWYAVSSGKKYLRVFSYFTGACGLSLLLSAIQLIPFLEFVKYSVRQSGMGIELAAKWSLHPYKLINFITPYFWGNPSESAYFGSDQFWASCFYCGVPVIILLLASLLFFSKHKKLLEKQEKKSVIFFSLLMISFFIISLGRYGFIYDLLYKYFFPFRMIRYPSVAMYGVVFSIAVLGGLLLDKLSVNIKNRSLMLGTMGVSVFLLLVVAFSYLYMNYFKIIVDPIRMGITNKALYTAGGLIISAAALVYLASKRNIKAGIFTLLFSAFLMLDLYINTSNIIPFTQTEEVFSKTKIEQYFKADNSDFRIATSPGTYAKFGQLYQNERMPGSRFKYSAYLKDAKRIMHDDYPMFCKIECFNVYDPMQLKRQDIMAYRLSVQNTAFETSLLNLFNVKYLLSYRDIEEKGLALRAKLDDLYIYENINVLPRAYIVYNILNGTDPAGAFKEVTAKEFSPLKYGVLEEPGISLLPASILKAEEAGVIYSSANRVLINFNAAVKGLLVLSDSYYPGWEAELDGVKTSILRTNYMFRGVIVPAGRHTVEMFYRPLSFRAGVAVTLVTLVFLLLVSIWIWERKISL